MAVKKMTEDEFNELREGDSGICLNCGEVRYGGTEPDAENYPCEECGKNKVQGVEMAIVCGNIEIVEGEACSD